MWLWVGYDYLWRNGECFAIWGISRFFIHIALSFSPILPSCLQFEKRLFIIRVLETLIDMKQLTGGYMDSKKLEILMTTADLGSFTKASEVVGYTQSA